MEVPISYNKRRAGKSKLSLIDGLKFLFLIFQYKIKR
jgi:hypothetical protein